MFKFHARLERNSVFFLLFLTGLASIGGLVEIVPLFTISETVEKVEGLRPYTPLEQTGRDIYIREGCNTCHSQMIRTLKDDVDRYGPYSLAAESSYDHPHLWGSKRTGPDLARIGGKYSDEWHVRHLVDPRSVVQGSIMPSYPFLASTKLETANLTLYLRALKTVGVPYSDVHIDNAEADLAIQATNEPDDAEALTARYDERVNIRDFDGNPRVITEMDALVAYLQVLGTMVDVNKWRREKYGAR